MVGDEGSNDGATRTDGRKLILVGKGVDVWDEGWIESVLLVD
jgi:hypothetical protein